MNVNSSSNYDRESLVVGATTVEGISMTLMVKPHCDEAAHFGCRLVTSFPSLVKDRRNEDIHNFHVSDILSLSDVINHITKAIDCRVVPGLSAADCSKEICRLIRKDRDILNAALRGDLTNWPKAESDQGSLLD